MANNRDSRHPNDPQREQRAQPSTAITVAPGVDVIPKERVAYLAETYDLKPPQILVVRNAICVGANDAELEFFLATCKRLQLDPFARQIWFVKRRQKVEDHFGNESWIDVGRPETGIDGYRTVAERTGEYEGQGPMQWCGPDGKWFEVWLRDEAPAAAKATLFRKGFREPLVNVARFSEFCPVLKNGQATQMWRRMPANQIAKCAEAGAFRRAFPRDLSGITTDTEMEHVDAAASFAAPPTPQPQPAKQLEAKPASVSVPADVTEQKTTPTVADSAKAIADSAHSDTTKLIESLLASGDDVDRVCAGMIEQLACSTARDGEDFVAVGQAITKAKLAAKQAKATGVEPDGFTLAVLSIVEPQLQKRWRELAPAVRGRKS